MGIRLSTDTWRAPLQLIDCWLPHPRAPQATRNAPQAPWLRRFVRAGWLGRQAATAPLETPSTCACGEPTATPASAQTHVPRRCPPTVRRTGTRMAISGRLLDVCAELDRLAALEHGAERS